MAGAGVEELLVIGAVEAVEVLADSCVVVDASADVVGAVEYMHIFPGVRIRVEHEVYQHMCRQRQCSLRWACA